MPAVPTALSMNQPTPTIPQSYLQWTHDGVDTDRFQILFRRVGDSDWQTFDIHFKTDALVSGTTYRADIGVTENSQWTVRAISSTNVPST